MKKWIGKLVMLSMVTTSVFASMVPVYAAGALPEVPKISKELKITVNKKDIKEKALLGDDKKIYVDLTKVLKAAGVSTTYLAMSKKEAEIERNDMRSQKDADGKAIYDEQFIISQRYEGQGKAFYSPTCGYDTYIKGKNFDMGISIKDFTTGVDSADPYSGVVLKSGNTVYNVWFSDKFEYGSPLLENKIFMKNKTYYANAYILYALPGFTITHDVKKGTVDISYKYTEVSKYYDAYDKEWQTE